MAAMAATVAWDHCFTPAHQPPRVVTSGVDYIVFKREYMGCVTTHNMLISGYVHDLAVAECGFTSLP